MIHIFRWTPGVIDTLRIPEGDSFSSRGQRPRKRAYPHRTTLKGSNQNVVATPQGASAGASATPSGSAGLRVNFPGALPPATAWCPFRAGRAGLGIQEVIRRPAHSPPCPAKDVGHTQPQRSGLIHSGSFLADKPLNLDLSTLDFSTLDCYRLTL